MSAQHTPGPWVNDGGLVCGQESRPQFAPSPSIDIFNANEWPANLEAEAHANARLIAAAPDLLEALKEMIPEGWDDGTMDHMPGIAIARAALAKAGAAR